MANSESKKNRWQSLYRLGGGCALVIAVLLLGEIIVYVLFPRPESVLKHFELFQENWLIGLLTLDLLSIISYLLFIPMILALYFILRSTSEAIMAVAGVLFFVGIANFFATNTAFSVLELSNQYAAATTEKEKEIFLAAGQAMFTLFNENAFLVSYVIVSAPWLLISVVMLRSHLFSRITAYSGVLAGAAGIIAVILEHINVLNSFLLLAIGLYFAAIIFLFIWVFLTGIKLWKLGKVIDN